MLDPLRKRCRFRMVVPAYPAFNVYSNIASMTTSLGPVYVATNVNKMPGWDAEVIDENNLYLHGPRAKTGGADHEILQQERAADVVGFYGGLTSTIPRLYALARFYKNKGAVTIAGGQHFVGDNIMDALHQGIDYIVLGEGEEAIQELLEVIAGSRDITRVKGIACLKDGELFRTSDREKLLDFDKLPLPDFSLVRYARIKVYPVERIRGCGMDCEFCTVKGKPRAASPQRLLEQIRSLVETRDARHFFIVDDLFGQHREETLQFCRMLKDYQMRIGKRLNFTAQIRLDKAKDTQLLSAMREAGIDMVCIGFESPIAEELEAMNKHIKSEDMVSLARIFHKFGFLVHGMFIFGYPLEDGTGFNMRVKERVKRYQEFIRSARLDTIQILLPVPLPGTELSDRLKRQNRVYATGDVGWEYYDGNFPIFEPDAPLTAELMQIAQRKIMASFYRFGYIFKIGLDVMTFPVIILFLHDIGFGWRKWYCSWRNDLIRFIGWTIVKEWGLSFKKDRFMEKLQTAKERVRITGSPI
ncbi:MAG: B12-binding domain-containing radical SAM protein [Candidatus Omnitrophica bacterium]|nr:B12-binding domain-containing radical SAM protein [Candidatus Omnitrophota bacterium]